jgi:hypothetical protein
MILEEGQIGVQTLNSARAASWNDMLQGPGCRTVLPALGGRQEGASGKSNTETKVELLGCNSLYIFKVLQ